MKRTIEITVSTTGDISIDALGFKGSGCEQATKFLEDALGIAAKKLKKPEFLQQNVSHRQQKLGQ
jgi:hypothetical protein